MKWTSKGPTRVCMRLDPAIQAVGELVNGLLLVRTGSPIAHSDTTPGKEFFCWALKTHGGYDELHRDSCHALYKSPRTSKQFYGQVVLHGDSGNSFGGLPSAIGASIYANGHQLRSGIALGHYEFTLQNRGLFDAPPPLIQLPAPLFIGSTSTRGASTHFGKVTRPDGVMLQLGQRSSDRDAWLWVPAGTCHNQASPWSSPLTLSHWRECNELHFISSLPPGGMQLVSGSADFTRHFPPMSAVGARCSPAQVVGEEEAAAAAVAKWVGDRRDPQQACYGRGDLIKLITGRK
jgi:hypothetical protein